MPTDKFKEYYQAYLEQEEQNKTNFGTDKPITPYRNARQRLESLGRTQQPQPQQAPNKNNILKALGYGLWSAGDTALFGLPSYALGEKDEEYFEDVAGTTAGQVFGGIGSAAGFLVPAGWVGRATSLGARGIGNLAGVATTQGLQKQAAAKVLDNLSKRVLQSKSTLKKDDAYDIVKKVTDPYIGTATQAPFWKKALPFSHGPSRTMELSKRAVDEAARNMTQGLPSKIAQEFGKRNIRLRKGAAQAMADDIVKITATKPLNSIETIVNKALGAKYSPGAADILRRIAGRSINEGVDLAITGTIMDYIRSKEEKGEPFSFGDSVLRHGALGGAFGFVNFIGGGSNESIARNFYKAFLQRSAKYNKTVDSMSLNQLKEAVRSQKKNGLNLTYTKDGVKRNIRNIDLDLNAGIKDKSILANALKEFNAETRKQVRKAFPGNAVADLRRSSPRMFAGSMASLADLAYHEDMQNMDPAMIAFHIGLGAFMTRRNHSLANPNAEHAPMYPQDTYNKVKNLESLGVEFDYMRDNLIDPTGSMYSDMAGRVENPDVDFILSKMEESGVIWRTENEKGETLSPPEVQINKDITAAKEQEINELLQPIINIARSRGYGFHRRIDLDKAENLLNTIKSTNSEVLSTEKNAQPLSNSYAIEASIANHSKKEWETWEDDMFDFFKNEMNIIAGSNIVDDNGVFPDIDVDYGKLTGDNKSLTRQNLSKLSIVKQKLKEEGIINPKEYKYGNVVGPKMVELTESQVKDFNESIDHMEITLGRKMWGENTEQRIALDEMDDLWYMMKSNRLMRSVKDVHDIIRGESEYFTDGDNEAISALIRRVLGSTNARNNDMIVDKASKIEITPESKADTNLSEAEIKKLESFKDYLWGVTSTFKTPSPTVPVNKVDIGDLATIYESMKKAGAPDIWDSPYRANEYYNRLIEHGVTKALNEVAVNPHTLSALSSLVKSGVAIVNVDQNQKGTRLLMPETVPDEVLRNFYNNSTSASKERVEANINDFKSRYEILKNQLIDANAVGFIDNVDIIDTDPGYIQAIVNASSLVDNTRPYQDLKETATAFEDAIGSRDRIIKELSDSISSLEETDPQIPEIKAAMNANLDIKNDLLNASNAFLRNISSNFNRANAFVLQSKRTGLFDLLQRISDNRPERILEGGLIKGPQGLNETIRLIESELLNSNGFTNPLDIQMSQNMFPREAKEIEGIYKENKSNTITADKLATKYNMDLSTLYDTEGIPLSSRNTEIETLGYLYETTVKADRIEGSAKFAAKIIDTMRDKDYPGTYDEKLNAIADDLGIGERDALIDDITSVINNYEARADIKVVTLTENGYGTYKQSQMSQGPLTDLITDIFNGEILILDSKMKGKKRFVNFGESVSSLATAENLLDRTIKVIYEKDAANMMVKDLSENQVVELDTGKFKEDELKSFAENGIALNSHRVEMPEGSVLVPVDEYTNLIIPKNNYHQLADSFVNWVKDLDPNTTLFDRFDTLRKQVENSFDNGKYKLDKFYKDRKDTLSNITDDRKDAMHEMFLAQYMYKTDPLSFDAVTQSVEGAAKWFKYARLPQNRSYKRHSQQSRDNILGLWGGVDGYKGDLVREFAPQKTFKKIVIDDDVDESVGSIANARSITEASYKKLLNDEIITKDQYNANIKRLEEIQSLDSETMNGQTAVSKRFFDYLFVKGGNSALINQGSAGHKPVEASVWTDKKTGVQHIVYNKTHYFYDSRFDPFFEKFAQEGIHQIGFKSGVKKAHKIKNGVDVFKAFKEDMPKAADGVDFYSWINNLTNRESASFENSIVETAWEGTLAGTTYGGPGNAKILKQMQNYISPASQTSLYNWGRWDGVKDFQEAAKRFYDPYNMGEANSEALSFLRNPENLEGITGDNFSQAESWVINGGHPLGTIAKNFFDMGIKSKYITEAGLFDGITGEGGSPTIRGNGGIDLAPPVYSEKNQGGLQIRLGESRISSRYLDRQISITAANDKNLNDLRRRPASKGAKSLTVSLNKGDRDVLIDLRSERVIDTGVRRFYKGKKKETDLYDTPTKANRNNIFRKPDSQEKKIISEFKKKIKNNELQTYSSLYSWLNRLDEDLNIVTTDVPHPRTGTQDIVVTKLKDPIAKEDGDVIEMNIYDTSVKSQRDFDTDGVTFYMDTPIDIIADAMLINGVIQEPKASTRKQLTDFNPLDRKSYLDHINKHLFMDRKRGSVMKMHRKVSWARTYFDKLPEKELKIGKDLSIRFATEDLDVIRTEYRAPNFLSTDGALQRLISDTQGVLDIYKGTPEVFLKNYEVTAGTSRYYDPWEDATLFGSTEKLINNETSTISDNPFFYLVQKDNVGTKHYMPIQNEVHKDIIYKILNDHGTILQLESKVYEGGQGKSPTYKNMVDTYNHMKKDYNPKYINRNFKKYLKNRGHLDEKDYADLDLKPLAEAVSKRILPVERVLEGISADNYLSANKIIGLGKAGEADSFANLVEKLRNTKDMEAIVSVKYGKDNLDQGFEKKIEPSLLEEIWSVYRNYETDEKRLVQINYLERQRLDLQRRLQEERKKTVYLKDNEDAQRNEAKITGLIEEVDGVTKLIDIYMNRLSLESTGKYSTPYPQKLTKTNKLLGKDKSSMSYTNNTFKDVALRWDKTGEPITIIKPKQTVEVKNNQVLIENPVVLKPVADFDLIDAAAMADAIGLTSYARIWDTQDVPHMKKFVNIVNQTKTKIKKINLATAESSIKDWGTNEIKIIQAIEDGAERIMKLAEEDGGSTLKVTKDAQKLVPTAFGDLPKATEDYPSAFFRAMLMPDQTTNKNEFHYFKGELIPAYKALNPSVIKHTLKAMKRYKVVDDFDDWFANLAKEHSNWLNAYLGNGNITDRINELATSSWEKSFLYKNIEEAYHSPFMRPEEYKTMEEYMDAYVGDSEFMNILQGIIEGRSIIDPKTLYSFRSEIRSKLGQANYDKIWKFAGKDVLGSIDGGRIHAKGEGEGQLLAQILYDRPFVNEWNSTLTHKPNKNKVKDFNDSIVEQYGKCK